MNFASVLSVFLTFVAVGRARDPTVETTSGLVRGRATEFSHKDTDVRRTVHVFKGIPYAEPPVGDLRFAPPKPKTPWQGEYDAADYGASCPQITMEIVPPEKLQDEDCLFLNVFVPQPRTVKAAVMIWIHGGGFMIGSGSHMYDATALVALNDVIVVTLNYRVGAFGFLSTGDDVLPGNNGLLDQIEALRWVQNNIAAFGGDPDCVTIFGESAGAMSAHLLVLSPLANGLFHRAIMQSGVANTDTALPSSVQNMLAHGLGKLVGCDGESSEELVACLRTVGTQAILNHSDLETLPVSPAYGNEFMAKSSHDLLRDKSFNKVDIMLGSMENEGVIFLLVMFAGLENENHVMLNKTTYDVLLPLLLRHPEKANPAVLDAIRLLYVDWEHVDNEDADYLDALCQMLGDHIFVCPADVAARAHYAAGQSVYLYHMTHTPARNVYQVAWAETAFHGDDIPFVFGYHFLPGIWMGRQDGEDVVVQWPMPEVEVQLSLEIMKYWTNFAKTGNPNLSALDDEDNGGWPSFKVPGLMYKELSPGLEVRDALKAAECAFWNDYIPKLVQHTGKSERCESEDRGAKKYSEDVNRP